MPIWLDRAVQVRALLDAAGELDRQVRSRKRSLGPPSVRLRSSQVPAFV
jgi:hypothetical protein